MTSTTTTIDQLCINTIRTLSMDAVQRAKSGHPGAPMGAAPMAYTLWTRFLRHNPANPRWPNRDRFVLSAGHASMLLYSLLHLTGYDLSLDDLKAFRQWGGKTAGHPEHGLAPGVEATTGPLGSGFAAGVGMAIAEAHLAARYNRPNYPVIDHYTYGLVSDGDLMEGIASEAASLAGTLALGKLIYLYDDNEISIEGSTDLAFQEDVGKRFEAYGWHVLRVDGEDIEAVAEALACARAETARPTLIVARTTIAQGSPNKAGTAGSHGSPLGAEEVALTRRALGWPDEPDFYVPDEALSHMRQARETGQSEEAAWCTLFDGYRRDYPAEAAELERALAGVLPANWKDALPRFGPEDGAMATRAASGKTLQALATALPTLIGGSADLAPSNNTYLAGLGDFSAGNREARNLHFGVREHAMAGICNGLALHGGMIPYAGTFLVFTDYMRGAMRLCALMGLNVTYVLTHDSIGVGEDGPTHQPVEHLASLRAMPGITVIRPADANETVAAWEVALTHEGPTALALTRQGVPTLTTPEQAAGLARGAYVLRQEEGGEPDVVLVATGSEVALALEAAGLLQEQGLRARVVSMPSWELFEEQDAIYQESVLPASTRARVSVEAAATLGWSRYVGDAGVAIGVDRFGASAPATVIFEQFGFTARAVADRAARVAARVRGA